MRQVTSRAQFRRLTLRSGGTSPNTSYSPRKTAVHGCIANRQTRLELRRRVAAGGVDLRGVRGTAHHAVVPQDGRPTNSIRPRRIGRRGHTGAHLRALTWCNNRRIRADSHDRSATEIYRAVNFLAVEYALALYKPFRVARETLWSMNDWHQHI